MAELILTQEEKDAVLWSDLDDATLGKLVKKRMVFLTDAAKQLDKAVETAAGLLLCSFASATPEKFARLTFEGVTEGDSDIGDWCVTIERKRPFWYQDEITAEGWIPSGQWIACKDLLPDPSIIENGRCKTVVAFSPAYLEDDGFDAIETVTAVYFVNNWEECGYTHWMYVPEFPRD